MDLLLTITVAFRALGRNKLRAGLTVLGVVIGIAAVTTMVSIGQSATALVQGQLQALGTNVLVVFPASVPRRRGRARHGRPHAHRHRRRRAHRRLPGGPGSDSVRRHLWSGDLRQLQLEATGRRGRRPGIPDRPQRPTPGRHLFHRPRHHRRRQGLRHRPNDRRQAVSDGRPDRPDDPHQEHPVQSDRRAGTEGGQHRRRGPGRHRPDPVHDGEKAAPGLDVRQRRRHHGVGPDQRADGRRRSADSATAVRAASHPARRTGGFSRAEHDRRSPTRSASSPAPSR